MKRSHRMEKVNNELKRVLSEIFLTEIPVQQDNIVTVLRVEATSDLNEAKVYVSALKNGQDVVEQLNQKSGYIRHLVGNRIKIRKVPKFKFILAEDLPILV
ncbi:MAG TPA: 30S ribosome-binding factor RbfA [Persephonella sp.]|uniref:Ribosome-binding factor A n=1 Tax=Persephonella marina (strain DSM 14350 / EX-H1) TaxID=123214 RepID=C0QU19_PERMH|nr:MULTISPECIES: 30S ribosome-binding factor RbfA [Persephonella]ACO04818.1 ribosome-binding factor A [Persephonella marina EX-H1]HCB70199.1 30S ribosome-binding factor RbfA [Persephonella sp.]